MSTTMIESQMKLRGTYVENTAARPVLIVNADDLGYSDAGDACILRAFHEGLVTSATLLVTGPSAASAARRASEAGLPLGLHLNLTEGAPVTAPSSMVSSLLDPSTGRFLGKHGLRRARPDAEHVHRETAAQLRMFSALVGRSPTHLDGHQHCHVIPGICEPVAKAMRDAGVTKTRLPLESAVRHWVMPAERRSFYVCVCAEARDALPVFEAHGVFAPSRFLGLSLMGADGCIERCWTALTSLPFGGKESEVCEWMVHPARAEILQSPPPSGIPSASNGRPVAGFGAEGPDEFAVSPERHLELERLCDTNLGWMVRRDEGVTLASFADVTLRPRCVRPASTVAIVASCIPLSGNHLTALRLRDYLATVGGWRVVVLDANVSRDAAELDATMTNEGVVVAVGLHALHGGSLLRACRVPYMIVLGGTDVNIVHEDPVAREVMRDALIRARRVVAFNSAMCRRARLSIVADALFDIVVVPQSAFVSRALELDFTVDDAADADGTNLIVLPLGVRIVKDPLFLLEVVRSRLARTAHMDIVGPVVDRTLADELRKRCGGNVRYLGPMPHSRLLHLMRRATVVANSSRSEGMSNALLEAMTLGKAVVVARRNEGNLSLIEHGVSGLLFNTPDEFADCVERVFADPQLRHALVRGASVTACRRFSPIVEARAYCDMVAVSAGSTG